MLFIRFFIFSILFFNKINDTPADRKIFVSPVRIQQLLSANFGELRVDHFHSGLDIKTQGVTGKEVVAVADGFVSRIGVSPTGFGYSLYVTHPSGYTTVYGHLERFSPAIEKYVISKQYEKKNFAISLFPSRDEFPVKQGQLIAYSGNSGSSGGPHLHFEVRKSDSERPVNPLLFDFGIADNIKPVIEKLIIYPVNYTSEVSNENAIKKLNVSGGNGSYTIAQSDGIPVTGLTGFGIKAYDLLNDSPNKCATYSIELKIDSTSIYKYVMDGFSFDESRYVNSHIDYETFIKDNVYYERTFVLPGDKLGAYENLINRGLYDFNDNRTHLVQIIVADINKNKSTLRFKIKSVSGRYLTTKAPVRDGIKIMPYDKANTFAAENVLVNIPTGALYDTLFFSYKKEAGLTWMLSDIHNIHNKLIPLQKPVTLSVKPTSVPDGKESKLLLIRLDDDKKIPVSSKWTDGYVTADILTLGKYYVGIDTVSPEITPLGFSAGSDLSGKRELKVRIIDRLSGIRSYEGSIDGNWILFEYDQKYDMLTYRFDEKRIKKGIKHDFSLKVTDSKGNANSYNCRFSW